MNDDYQHELDDELLSAYLDGELSAEERALVEVRLASDPSAQQLLDQLRNVSRSVRDLPPAGADRDFREAVLQRVGQQQSAPAPKITIGRTRRGWVWATVAVAAALLLMAFQADDSRNGEKAEVARRQNPSAEAERRPREAPAQWRVPGGPGEVEEPPADAPAMAARESTTRERAKQPAPGATAFVDESFGIADSAKADRYAAPAPPPSSVSSTEGAPLARAPKPAPAIDEDGLVVVNVLAKEAALKNKSFDRLLAGCGVAVDPPADAEDAPAAVAHDFEPPQVPKRLAEQPPVAEEEVDLVLVEASPRTIFQCMSDLNQDVENYVGVSVAASTESGVESKRKTPLVAKLESDLKKFSRGMVPQQLTKGELARNLNYYGHQPTGRAAVVGPEAGEIAAGGPEAGGVGAASGDQSVDSKQQMLDSLGLEAADRGRARRLTTRAAPTREAEVAMQQESADRRAYSFSGQLPRTEGLSKVDDPAESERLQVLFVLRPADDATPSAPAANRAE